MPRSASSILNGKVNFPLCLAPMVGPSHVALRLLVREYLPANLKTIWPTEMLNSRRLPGEDLNKLPEAFRDECESEMVPQILGNDERYISQSVGKLSEWGASAIDINMGCPVKKAISHNYGVALMGDAKYAAEVVRVTVKHTRLPVSVKLRAGLVADPEFLYRFVSLLCDAGASWITLHPRTAQQQRRGSADWSQIKFLKDKIAVPVIGNGDIQTVEDIHEMLSTTSCDMVMAGRALAAKPWLMWQLAEDLDCEQLPRAAGGRAKAPRGPVEEGAEYGRALHRFIELLGDNFAERLGSDEPALRRLKFYLRTTSVWLPFGHDLMAKVSKAQSLAHAAETVSKFFTQNIEMSPRTSLRQ